MSLKIRLIMRQESLIKGESRSPFEGNGHLCLAFPLRSPCQDTVTRSSTRGSGPTFPGPRGDPARCPLPCFPLNLSPEVPYDPEISKFKGLPQPRAFDLWVVFGSREPKGDPAPCHRPWRNSSGLGLSDTVYRGLTTGHSCAETPSETSTRKHPAS